MIKYNDIAHGLSLPCAIIFLFVYYFIDIGKERKIILMREIKLPDEFDIDVCQKEKALKEAEQCVYCGSKRLEREDPNIIKIKEGFLKKKTMCEIICKCKDCGAKYATEPYSLDKKMEKKMKASSDRMIKNIILSCLLCLGFISSIFIVKSEIATEIVIIPIICIIGVSIITGFNGIVNEDIASTVTFASSVPILMIVIAILGLSDIDYTDIYVYNKNGEIKKVYKNVDSCTIEYIDDNNVLFNDPETGSDVYYSKEKIKIKDEE